MLPLLAGCQLRHLELLQYVTLHFSVAELYDLHHLHLFDQVSAVGGTSSAHVSPQVSYMSYLSFHTFCRM